MFVARWRIGLSGKDPAAAEAMVETLRSPTLKIDALTRMARELDTSARGRKRVLLEKATALGEQNDRRQKTSPRVPHSRSCRARGAVAGPG